MSNLTIRKRQILKAILTFTKENKYPPTVREVGEMVGLRSPSTTQKHLEDLRLLGLVNWEPCMPRTLTVIKKDEEYEKATS